MRNLVHWAAGSAGALLLVGCAPSTSDVSTTEPPATEPDRVAVQIVEAEDVRPSNTVADWVTYADYIAVVSVQSDTLRQPTKTEVARGEGSMLRDLKLSVDKILWSSPRATTKLPRSIGWSAIGSAFKEGGSSVTPLAIADTPRMERGHTYVLAVYRHPEICSAGDEQPAFWDGLGAGSVLPFDGGVIGNGESAGNRQTATDARRQAGTVEGKLAGSSAAALVDSLRTARPHATKQAPYKDPACG